MKLPRLLARLLSVALALLLAAAALRWLIPGAAGEQGGPLVARLAWLGAQHGPAVAAAFFVLFSGLLRVWIPPPAKAAAPGSSAAPGRSIWPLALGVLLAAGAGVAWHRVGFPTVKVVSGSMLPTLLPGDHLLVSGRGAGADLRRGEVIVFPAPEAGDGPPELVKRVIGLPGDRITMDGSRPVINGRAVPACDAGLYVYFGRGGDRLTRGRLMVEWLADRPHLAIHEAGAPGFVSFVVPPGQLFVLGDNRGISNDSRSWRGGQGAGVAAAAVLGRVRRVIAGRTRDGRLDGDRLWRGLGTQDLHLSGVDLSEARAGIVRCLQQAAPSGAMVSRS